MPEQVGQRNTEGFSGRNFAGEVADAHAERPLDRFVAPGAPAELDAIRAELADAPNLMIHQLSEAEQARLRFRVVACAHAPAYAAAVADAIGPVDYYISENILEGAADRPAFDLLLNAGAQNLAVSERKASGELVAARQSVDEMEAAYIGSEHYRSAQKKPVLRSMDMHMSEPFAIGEVPHLRHLFPDKAHLSMGDLDQVERKLTRQLYSGLAHNRVNTSRQRMRDLVDVTAIDSRIREQRQIDDISVIAANAVRRHPESEHITIGVLQGLVHDKVLGSLLDGTSAAGNVLHVPHDEEEPMLTQAAILAAETGESPNDATIDAALFDEYAAFLTEARYGEKGSSKINSELFADIHSHVTPAEIADFLSWIDGLIAGGRGATILDAVELETHDIPDRLLEIPAMAAAVERVDPMVKTS